MAQVTRRRAITTLAGTGTALAFHVSESPAQAPIDFTPLKLNRNGQQNVNQSVSRLDQHEDDLLDDLLSGNTNGEAQDLRTLNGDFQNLMQNPGIQGNANGLRQEAQMCQNKINIILRNRQFGWGSIQPCIKQIDFFVGHWYPCNDILEIGKCEFKIWDCLTKRPEPFLLSYYFQHLFYEMHSICQFHQSSDARFFRQKQQLFNLGGAYSRHLQTRDYRSCRTDFQQFTTATSLFFRRYYPQWC